MALVVLKFGGTSLANIKLMNNAVTKVMAEVALGNRVIVVVSAMAGVTDHLVNLVHEISNCDTEDQRAEYANVITTGEQVSAGLLALLLQQAGLKARSWLGWQAGIITDNNIIDSNIIELQCEQINEAFIQGDQVAIVTGFQGITRDNRISTLGRGGSDTSAIILAGALQALRCDIYTDVEGVFTADPRIVAKAQKLDRLTYDEMIAFAHAGAKVLQAKSVEWAKHYQVNLQVLSSFTAHQGTFICDNEHAKSVAGIALGKEDADAKITIIGKNITKLQELKKLLQNNEIEIITMQETGMSVVFIIKDKDKFDAMRYLHTACNLDGN